MSDLTFCQGPDCHTYTTQDRLKGPKGNKTYQTRRRSNFYYGRGYFCDHRCLYDWVAQYIEQSLERYGRTTETKHLTEENAWIKDFDFGGGNDRTYFMINSITRERRPLTQAQYNDRNYTINTEE